MEHQYLKVAAAPDPFAMVAQIREAFDAANYQQVYWLAEQLNSLAAQIHESDYEFDNTPWYRYVPYTYPNEEDPQSQERQDLQKVLTEATFDYTYNRRQLFFNLQLITEHITKRYTEDKLNKFTPGIKEQYLNAKRKQLAESGDTADIQGMLLHDEGTWGEAARGMDIDELNNLSDGLMQWGLQENDPIFKQILKAEAAVEWIGIDIKHMQEAIAEFQQQEAKWQQLITQAHEETSGFFQQKFPDGWTPYNTGFDPREHFKLQMPQGPETFPPEWTASAKTAIDWMGDAYRQDRTEEQTLQEDYTETQFDDPQDHVEEQNWILTGNHVLVTKDDPSTMFGRMGFGDTDQPHAYGTVDLYYNYEAMFSVERSNIAAHVVERALRKFCKQNDLAFEGLLSQDGTLFSSKDSSIKTAEVPGVGRQLPEKLWRIHYDGEDQPVDFYGEQDDDWNENKPQGPMECPHCGEPCNSYGDFLVHENKEHSDGLSIPDSPQPVVDMDDVMPAHWNTSPSGDSTIKRQAAYSDTPPPGPLLQQIINDGVRDFQGLHGDEPAQGTDWAAWEAATLAFRSLFDPEAEGFSTVNDPEGNAERIQDYKPHYDLGAVMQENPWLQEYTNDALEGEDDPALRALTQIWHIVYDHLQDMNAPEVSGANWPDTLPWDEEGNEYYRNASWQPNIVMLAGQGLIQAPLPFIFDIENDIIHTGHPGEKHSDIKTPGKLTVNVVEGLYTPDKKIQFKTDSTMPYSVRHMILLWYHLYPELEVKHVEKIVGNKKLKLAKKNIGPRVRDLAFTDQAVREAYSALSQYANVYAVGGAVRDIVLGHIPKDIDLLAQGIPPQQIETLLQTLPGRVDFTGKAFGVFRYKAEDGSEVEIALPRTETSTGEGHKEFQVLTDPFLSVEEDLARRDFTGNAMAVSLQTSELTDPYNGQADLSQGKLKVVNPQAFKDDPLRILRAFSAMSRQGLRPDEETEKEIRKESYRLRALPAERLQMELDKIFAGKDPEGAIRAMRDTGVLHYVLPEVAATIDFDQKNKHHRKMLDEHLLDVLRRAAEESGDPDLRLAALLHDIGKPASQWMDEEGNGHYYKKIHLDPVTHKPTGEESGANHHEVGAQMTNDLMERLKYPKSRIDRVKHLVNHHMFNPFDNPKGARKFINQVGPEHANDLLTLRRADQEGKGTDEWENQTPVALQRQLVDRVNQEDEATQVSDLAVNGNDLIKEGIPASPEMGRVLNKLLEAVLERPELNTPEQLLEMARNLHMMKDASVQKYTNILDDIKDSLDEQVFTNADADMPKLKPKIRHWIKKSIYKVLRDNGYPDPENWLHLILTGSLTTYQWSPASDFDVSLWVDFENIPDWRRADLISLMVHHLDGVTVPGTTHTLQAYVVPEHVGRDDLYRPGLRSAYDIDKDQWMILPEKSRTIDVNKEMRSALIYAKEMAYKMKLLILYDMPGAKEFWRQLHQRRKQDMAAGKGDYAGSNVVFKYLEKHFLDPTKVVTSRTSMDGQVEQINEDGMARIRIASTSKVNWRKKYNYRNAEGEKTCGSCAALDKHGRCAMFNSFVKKSSVCNEWTDTFGGSPIGSGA